MDPFVEERRVCGAGDNWPHRGVGCRAPRGKAPLRARKGSLPTLISGENIITQVFFLNNLSGLILKMESV